MLNRFAGLLLTAALFSAACAQAADYKATFTAKDFRSHKGRPAPDSVVTGTFIFSAATASSSWDALQSIDLVINGHRYDLAEVGIALGNSTFYVGGLIGGVGALNYPAEDFVFLKYNGKYGFSYASDSIYDSWFAKSVTVSISAVPEPETYAMLLAGLGLMGFVARRRKA